MENITIVGTQDLDEIELDCIKRISQRYKGKIQRALRNTTGLLLHVKSYDKPGRSRKYTIHAKTRAPTVTFVSTKGIDWDINRALHKSFIDLINQIEHRFHGSDQHKKAISIRRNNGAFFRP